jgi:hypothetical protein
MIQLRFLSGAHMVEGCKSPTFTRAVAENVFHAAIINQPLPFLRFCDVTV